MRHRARQTSLGGMASCLARSLRRGAPCRCRRLV
jgi:hypothetical protein